MRILFDQATPVPIRPYLKGHEVRTAAQQEWGTLKNGELLAAAEANGFDVLLTTDKNMRYQQNLGGRKIAVVVLGLQQWPSLRPNIALVVKAVGAAIPGSYTEVDFPSHAEHGRL
jgi:predicted nuclease of predicted toxin-antitoxin system